MQQYLCYGGYIFTGSPNYIESKVRTENGLETWHILSSVDYRSPYRYDSSDHTQGENEFFEEEVHKLLSDHDYVSPVIPRNTIMTDLTVNGKDDGTFVVTANLLLLGTVEVMEQAVFSGFNFMEKIKGESANAVFS